MNLRFITISLLTIVSFSACAQTGSTKLSNDSLNNDESVFEKVEIEAAFTGGASAWFKYLQSKLNPNVPVNNGAPAGCYTVYVQFVVNKDGNIQNVKPLTHHGYGMEQEVVRIIKMGPKWEPAMQKGRKVNAYRKQPVTFMVEDDNIEITSKDKYILYTGIENAVTIKVKKVKADDLGVTISQGSITSKGDGRYVIKVNKTGTAVITLFNAKRGSKELGAVTFDVK